ncbi:MAG TPA: HD domain-containing phosphohydrolase [Planctomycetaceae bacterium]|jgi:putative two-component system response regulator|nr:HD domain-containing phosphohydrolase [Planctomycetaceae bacterium]
MSQLTELDELPKTSTGVPTDRKPKLVCVDDEPMILEILERLVELRGLDWDVEVFSDSLKAWDYLRLNEADIIVTDVSMPGLSGPDLVRRLRKNESTRDTPVVVLTGLHEASLKRQVLDLGATDLLSKPIQPDELLARLRSALRLKQMQDALKRQNERLEQTVLERTRQLQASRIEIIWRLAKAAEFRDEQTGSHVLRVAHYCRIIAEALGQPRAFVETVFLSAPLHDLGKIGIPDAILHKPGRLTVAEREIVKTHCEIGERILSGPRHSKQLLHFGVGSLPEDAFCGEEDPVLRMAREIAASHHERWDGAGYPRGLAGEAIALSGRITAVADVYDALTSTRPYKCAIESDEAFELIRSEAGKHFDPVVCEAFLHSRAKIQEIQNRLSDNHSAANTPCVWRESPNVSLVSDALLTAVPLHTP